MLYHNAEVFPWLLALLKICSFENFPVEKPASLTCCCHGLPHTQGNICLGGSESSGRLSFSSYRCLSPTNSCNYQSEVGIHTCLLLYCLNIYHLHGTLLQIFPFSLQAYSLGLCYATLVLHIYGEACLSVTSHRSTQHMDCLGLVIGCLNVSPTGISLYTDSNQLPVGTQDNVSISFHRYFWHNWCIIGKVKTILAAFMKISV